VTTGEQAGSTHLRLGSVLTITLSRLLPLLGLSLRRTRTRLARRCLQLLRLGRALALAQRR
jgi:hypothetical protein